MAVFEHYDTATMMLSTDRTLSGVSTKKQLTKKLKPEAGDCAAIKDHEVSVEQQVE